MRQMWQISPPVADLEELRVPQVAQRVDAADQFVELEDRLAHGVMG